MASSQDGNQKDLFRGSHNPHGGRSQQNQMAMSMTSSSEKEMNLKRMVNSCNGGTRPKELMKGSRLEQGHPMVHKPSTGSTRQACSDAKTVSATVPHYRDSAMAETSTGNTKQERTINMKVMYILAGRNNSEETHECYPCNLDNYLRWLYIVGTPAILEACNKQLETVDGRPKLFDDFKLIIHDSIETLSHVEKIIEKTIAIVLKHRRNLVVDVFVIKNGNAEKCVEKLRSSKFKQFLVETVAEDRVGVVYDCAVEDAMKTHFANMLGQDLKPVEYETEISYDMDLIFSDIFSKTSYENVITKACSNVRITFELLPDVMVCHLKGLSSEVEKARGHLKWFEGKTKYRKCKFPAKVSEHLHKLNVAEELDMHLEKQNLGCVVKQFENVVCVYGIDDNVLWNASVVISKYISQDSVLVTGKWKEAGNIEKLIKDVITSYQNRIVLQYCEGARLYIVGFSDSVQKAEQEIVELMLTQASAVVVENNEQFVALKSLTLEISFKNDVRIQLLENPELCGFTLSGLEENVVAASKAMEEAKKCVCVKRLCVPAKLVSSTSGKATLEEIEKRHGVSIEIIGTNTEGTNTEDASATGEMKGPGIWEFSKHCKLVLVKAPIKDCGANVIIHTELEKQHKETISQRRLEETFREVDVGIPPWNGGCRKEKEKLEKLVERILTKTCEDNEDSIAISIEPLGAWPYALYVECFAQAVVRFFHDAPKNLKPLFVMLVTDSVDMFQMAGRSINDTIDRKSRDESEENLKDIKVEVVSGELNKTQADVLVNTTARNLDLSHGRVSAALLQTAGVGIQQECQKHYPNGIDRGVVAVTGGYNLKCHNVFHGTFAKYNKDYSMECIQDLRDFMKTCLEAASDYSRKSIAFPVIGTGNLHYPADLVAAEMFLSVERFRKDCKKTSLEHVMFVVYYADQAVLQIFQKMENNLVKREEERKKEEKRKKEKEREKEKSSEVQVKIIGMKPNVVKAKEQLEKEIRQVGTNATKIKKENKSSRHQNSSPAELGGATASSDGSSQLYKPVSQTQFSWSSYARNMKVYKLGHLFVKVYEADILQAPVECIVNAANKDLQHKGGVAYDIARAAGEELDRECKMVLHDRPGHLKVGDVVMTTAGHLHFKCVLHAVGPCWDDYKPITEERLQRCENDLYKAVFNSFNEAERLQLKSVALPAISSAIFAVPKEICCTMYAEALKAVYHILYHVKEIHFVDLDHEMINLIQSTFNVMIVDNKPSPYNRDVYLHPAVTTDRKSDVKDNLKYIQEKSVSDKGAIKVHGTSRSPTEVRKRIGRGKSDMSYTVKGKPDVPTSAAAAAAAAAAVFEGDPLKNSRSGTSENAMSNSVMRPQRDSYPNFIEDRGQLSCHFTDTHDIYIYTGDILNVDKVNAIVCSEDKSGNGKGMVAEELLKVGGNEYKIEKDQAFRAHPQFGDVFITRGGKSWFRYIIHAIIPHNQPVALGHVFMKIFKEAVHDMVGSIAMSLIGSGAAKTEPKQAAEMLFNSYKVFCQENADKLLVVHVVNLDKSITDTVISVFKDNIGYKTQAQAITDPMNDSRRNPGSTRKKPVQGKGDPYEKSRYMTEGTKQTESGQHTSSGGANLRTGDEPGSKSTETVQKAREEEKEDNCVICMDKIDDPKKLKCGHVFCKDCIDQYFKIKQACPTCGTVCGIITGDQPSSGQMEIMKLKTGVAGYQGMGSIAASYSFPDGYQEAHHPRPKAWYKGITRTAYLPDNEEGRKICAMLREAFNRKLVFTIGVSRTTGQEGVITWNDIHHKTDPRPNTQFGYPDPTYMARVTDELGAKGVTEADIDPAFLKKIKSLIGNKRLSNL